MSLLFNEFSVSNLWIWFYYDVYETIIIKVVISKALLINNVDYACFTLK